MKLFDQKINYVFGGYHKDKDIRFGSTSGGAFSAISEVYCDEDYVIFGAEAEGIRVFHSYITDKTLLDKFRKSKYSQSEMGDTYKAVKSFLEIGKKVLFSGTPCQVAGLKMFLRNIDTSRLLTVEVVCEGVPSPLYIRKYEEAIQKKYGKEMVSLDYRYTGESNFSCEKRPAIDHKDNGKSGKWDFQIMRTELSDGRAIIVDRWFNPFWSIWLNHLMSRPSCNVCPFARKQRVADITLGDLWGIHLYCPELYGNNGGASVVFSNTEKGKDILLKARQNMFGHELPVEKALKYQSPMREHIDVNSRRDEFMADLQSNMSYDEINKKWAKKPTVKLLWQKYIWGNRQKIRRWNMTNGKYHIK